MLIDLLVDGSSKFQKRVSTDDFGSLQDESTADPDELRGLHGGDLILENDVFDPSDAGSWTPAAECPWGGSCRYSKD